MPHPSSGQKMLSARSAAAVRPSRPAALDNTSRAAKRQLVAHAASSSQSSSTRREVYPSTKSERRDLERVVTSAVAADTISEGSTQTEPAVWTSSEEVDYIVEATIEMGVEDLFVEEAEVEVLEEEEQVYNDDELSLQEALDCTTQREQSVIPEDFSAPKSDTSTQISDLCLAFPLSDVQMPTYTGAELDVGIAHFGVGGFFRAHQMAYMDYLLRHNLEQNKRWGYIGIGMLSQDKAMRDALREQENMYTVVAHSATASDGAAPANEVNENVRVVAALKDMLLAPEEPGQVLRTLASEGTKIFSLTITEFGYTVPASRADMALAKIAKDAAKEPWAAMDANAKRYTGATAIGMIVAGLEARRAFGTGGATVLSCDNIPGNGDYVRDKVLERAETIGGGLKEWILFNCTFPNCMVDRITPMTSEAVKRSLSDKHGVKDNWPVACETFSQWVIEDNFVEGFSGRPRWETVGVQLVKDVKPYELAKIRLLNVTHSVMTFPALLMGLEHVHDAATNPLVREYFEYVMREELRPTLLDIEGIENINLEAYQGILVERFSNTLVADTLMRISHDTSNKFSIQGCPTVREGLALGLSMKGMALMVACWAHFILKCRRAGMEFKDGQAAALEAAMAGSDINALLDIEPVFHDLMFEDGWRELAVGYFEAVNTEGIRKVMRDFNASNAK